MAIRLLDLRRHWHLFDNSPHKAHEFTGHSDDDLVGMFPSCHQASKAFAQPHWRLPADILDGFGLWFEPSL